MILDFELNSFKLVPNLFYRSSKHPTVRIRHAEVTPSGPEEEKTEELEVNEGKYKTHESLYFWFTY